MGSIITLAFNTVFPLLAMMLLGVFIRSKGYISDETIKYLNMLSSRVFIPFLLFYNIYDSDLRSTFKLNLFLFELMCVAVIFLLLYFLVPVLVKDRKRRYTVFTGMYWPNCMMFALPVLTSLCGEAGRQTGTMMIVTVAPLFSAGTVVITELYRNSEKVRLGHLLKSIALNPMLWGSLLGLALNLLGVDLPAALTSPIKSVAGIATPLALIALGAFFNRASLRSLLRVTALGCVVKLFAIPAMVLAAGLAFGYSGLSLLGLVVIFASPSAVSTFSISDPAYSQPELAALLVSASSLFSVVSYFIWIILLSAIGVV